MPPCLPNEIIDTIILETKDPAIAIIATSPYCVYKMIKFFNESTYLYIIRNELVKELLWLVECEFVHPFKLCSKVAYHGSVEFFKRMLPLLVKKSVLTQNNNDDFTEIIQAAVRSGSVEKVHFLLSHNVLIKSISDLKNLKRYPTMLTYLADKLFDTPEVIFTEDAVTAAIHSDNITFIRIAERQVNIRNMISYKDIIIAAHIGCFNVLRWFHQACACETSRFASCVFDKDIYNVAARAGHTNIIRWLKHNTNCIYTQGFPLHHEFDFPRLLSPFQWFL